MKLEKTLNDECMTVALTGRLDGVTAPVLGELVDRQLGGISELILDFDGLDYVSSAGLRVILSAQKKMSARHGSMVVKNGEDDASREAAPAAARGRYSRCAR